MVAEIEDLLRLAWRAEGDGKPGLRDALLTLAVVDAGGENPVLAERGRKMLVARRPEHWFAGAPTLGRALADPRVVASVGRLRATFPPVRVQRQLLRYAAQEGPFTGRTTPLARVLDDLALTDGRRPVSDVHALPFPGAGEGDSDPDGSIPLLYFTVLLAMAVLLKSVIEPATRDTKAA